MKVRLQEWKWGYKNESEATRMKVRLRGWKWGYKNESEATRMKVRLRGWKWGYEDESETPGWKWRQIRHSFSTPCEGQIYYIFFYFRNNDKIMCSNVHNCTRCKNNIHLVTESSVCCSMTLKVFTKILFGSEKKPFKWKINTLIEFFPFLHPASATWRV